MAPRTPWGHDAPERRASRTQSHWCDRVGATVYCPLAGCPYCGTTADGGADSGDADEEGGA